MKRKNGFTLDKTNGDPLYKQLFDQIVERIGSRAFPPGFRLPPTRQLATELGSNRNTIVRVYTDLETAGFVRSTVGRGTFVVEAVPGAIPTPAPKVEGLSWSSLVSVQAKATSARQSHRFGRGAGDQVINLSRMEPSSDLIPDVLIRRCFEHVLRAKGGAALGYTPAEGLGRLRELIAVDLGRQGVPAHADDILITTGSQQGLDLIARALITPGDLFLVDSATYAGAINILTLAGARLVPVPSDAEGPEMGALERLARSGAKGFYLMPNCNNPTGAEITEARRRQLVAWSLRSGTPLIEDDYGADLWLEGHAPPPALRSLSGEVLYTGTFSKKLVPALRIGFILAPRELRPTLVAIKHSTDLGTSLVLQMALAEFLERGYFRAHLNRTLPEYRARRDALEQALTRYLPPGMPWRHPERGLVLWLPLPKAIDPEVVFEEARRRGVLVGPGGLYEVEARGEPGLRLTFCAEPPDRLALGGRRLGEALKAIIRHGRAAHAAPVEAQAV
jgi:2-aminoadipate transaminase